MAKLTDFFEGAIGKANYSRLELWKDKVVIDRRGQVRYNQKVLIKLGELPDEPRVIVSSPDDKTLMFWFVSKEYTCLLYTSPSPRDRQKSRMPSSA